MSINYKLCLIDVDGQLNVDGLGWQALFVVARLVTELASNRQDTRRCIGRHFELGDDIESSTEYRDRFVRKVVLLELRLWILHLLNLKRTTNPREPQRNQIFVSRRVAIHVIALAQIGSELSCDSAATFRRYPFEGRDREDRDPANFRQ